ncbi:MAG TPA: DUF3846 domain-containing protein [Actinocrinis sp.]|jgi:hypothetical protein
MKALSIDLHGRVTDVELSANRSVSVVRGLRAVIGCSMVERLVVDGGLALWVDENGIAEGRAVNGPASLLARERGVPMQLHGPAVVTGAVGQWGRTVGLRGAQIADLRRRLEAWDPVGSRV